MDIKNKIKRWTNDKKAKKNSKEPKRNPFFMTDYCILKDKIEHQGIGGKKAYFDRSNVGPYEIAEKAMWDHNIACIQFMKRRPDLFKEADKVFNFDHPKGARIQDLVLAKGLSKKYHYVKIWNTNPAIYPEYTYLGYIICSDEIKKTCKVGNKND